MFLEEFSRFVSVFIFSFDIFFNDLSGDDKPKANKA